MSEQEIQRYEQMLAKDPKSRAFAPLAEIYRKLGRLDDAIQVADQGLRHNPRYAGGLVVMGRSLFERGDVDRAIEVMEKAVQEAPENYLAQKFLGKVLGARGHNDRAIRALEAANILSPGDREVESDLTVLKTKVAPPKRISFEPSAAAQGAEFTHQPSQQPPPIEPEPAVEEIENLAPIEELVEVENFSVEVEETLAAQPDGVDPAPAPAAPAAAEPAPRPPVAADEGIATETLADLYAKQGFSDRAARIYRQLLERRPGDGALLLKLSQIDQASGQGTDLDEHSPPAAQRPPQAPSPGAGNRDASAVLEAWLANLERMKAR